MNNKLPDVNQLLTEVSVPASELSEVKVLVPLIVTYNIIIQVEHDVTRAKFGLVDIKKQLNDFITHDKHVAGSYLALNLNILEPRKKRTIHKIIVDDALKAQIMRDHDYLNDILKRFHFTGKTGKTSVKVVTSPDDKEAKKKIRASKAFRAVTFKYNLNSIKSIVNRLSTLLQTFPDETVNKPLDSSQYSKGYLGYFNYLKQNDKTGCYSNINVNHTILKLSKKTLKKHTEWTPSNAVFCNMSEDFFLKFFDFMECETYTFPPGLVDNNTSPEDNKINNSSSEDNKINNSSSDEDKNTSSEDDNNNTPSS